MSFPEPLSGPVVSVLVHERKKILIKWDELPVDQRRGFITSYTIYYYVVDSGNSENSELSGEFSLMYSLCLYTVEMKTFC